MNVGELLAIELRTVTNGYCYSLKFVGSRNTIWYRTYANISAIFAHASKAVWSFPLVAPNNISSISVPQYSISDHLPVCLTRTTQNLSDKGSVHKHIRYRTTEQFDENAFLSNLAQQSWSTINSYEDHSAAVQPGWVNQEILNSIKTAIVQWCHKL